MMKNKIIITVKLLLSIIFGSVSFYTFSKVGVGILGSLILALLATLGFIGGMLW